jgi:hypothetical protein
MVDFSQLSKLEVVGDKTVDYILDQLESQPTLKMLPANQANKPYHSALLRKSGRRIKALQKRKINEKILKENREEDKELYVKHIIKGWSGIVDAQGKNVPFNEESVTEFLDGIPVWLFEEIREFASDIDNFIAEQIDTEDVAKN